MNLDIFDYDDYKSYLTAKLELEYGAKVKLAASINCKPAFITQVLSGTSHFSQEHCVQICEHLNLNNLESDYLVFLVLHERSGSEKLRLYYKLKLDQISAQRHLDYGKQVKTESEMTDIQKQEFYSSWFHSAIHILLSISIYDQPHSIATRLGLDIQTVKNSLEFLEELGLVRLEKGQYSIGARRIHLEKASPLIVKHHLAWRIRAMSSIEQRDANNLHYSAVSSLSKKDFHRIRKDLISAISSAEQVVKGSPEEEAFALNIDWFKI